MQVCRVALFLTDRWNVKQNVLNRDLIFASALLHDITKTRSFDTGEDHAETGGRLLEDLDYPEVGEIIAQHVRLNSYDGNNGFPTEAEIVNYADKRVLHDKIVTFPQRMEYIVERYGHITSVRTRLNLIWKKSTDLESKIFSGLDIKPNDLCGLLAGPPIIEW
jgi:putative nucleotidyltransferase with HDIG domain